MQRQYLLDEAPILFQFEAIAELIGRLCANGAKAGIRVILSAQEPDPIYQSKSIIFMTYLQMSYHT